jgi:DNA polymerase III gamma/tau subunit
VTQLLGIAPAERLTGLVRHLVERNAASALAELEAAIDGGVDVGQLLDQLVGYFRDVMTAAVGCPPEQMLYALPSQSAEVVEIGSRLGVETILAIVQVLDQTSSRMRITMHGRTLVEMAVVRICNLEDLDELAALAAELRGETPAKQPTDARSAAPAPARVPTPPVAPTASKKNDEMLAAVAGLGSLPALPELENHVAIAPRAVESVESSNGADDVTHESVLKRFQDVISAAPTAAIAPAAPRVSRRVQLLAQSREVSTRPFVQKAMELFDVRAGQFRYTPPEGDTTS